MMKSFRKPRRNFKILLPLLSLFYCCLAPAEEQQSNAQAIALLEKSLEAYGGRSAANSFTISLTASSNYRNEGQSVTPGAPFETYPFRIELKIDQISNNLVACIDSAIAGDFVFSDCTYLNKGKGYSVNHKLKTYQDTNSEPWVVSFLFPHKQILQAIQSSDSLQLNDSKVSYAAPNGRTVTLSINPETLLIDQMTVALPMGVYGDGTREIQFNNYRKAGALMIPGKLTMINRTTVHGNIQNDYTLESITTAVKLDPAEFDLPADYSQADYSYRKPFHVRELAKDVYLFENVSGETGQWSYNVLVAVFDEFVVVAEAPVNSAISDSVLKKIAELAPGKKVRYVVQSHHHSDHLGGIRSYIAEGSTILTGPNSIPLIEKIAAAPFQLNPDRLHKNPAKPVIQAVQDKHVIQDDHHQLIVYNIGPSPHAVDMLIVYFPREKILYQSDMINDGEYPENATTRDFGTKIKKLGLQHRILAGLHGKLRGVQ
jgi:glyoxylase-like metal-dependent hydrolase (beta-lactamase superfamily II)